MSTSYKREPQWAAELRDKYRHRQRLRFIGLLVPLDLPSDRPPHGSGNRRVILPSRTAVEIAWTLVDKPVRRKHFAEAVGIVQMVWIAHGGLYVAGQLNEGEAECLCSGMSLEMTGGEVECRTVDVWRICAGVLTGVSLVAVDAKPAWNRTWVKWLGGRNGSGMFVIDGGKAYA